MSRPDVAYWLGVVCLLVVVHATQDRLDSVLAHLAGVSQIGFIDTKRASLLAYAACIKGMLFAASLAVLAAPILRDICSRLALLTRREVLSAALFTMGMLVMLGVLVFRLGYDRAMGEAYALHSQAPFAQVADDYHKRLLMPAVAHLLFFRGGWLYFAFSFLVTGGFLVALRGWLKDHAPLPFWQLLSLCTSSFVIFQFQYPGYADILAFVLLIPVMSDGFAQRSRLAVLVLALLTHESSLFIGSVLAWRFLDKKHAASYALVLLLYGLAWLAGFRFRLDELLCSHNLGQISGLQWVIRHPREELLGLFMAFKALWVLLAVAVWVAVRQRDWTDAVFVGLCGGVAVFMTFLGVDTSRMAGWAFPGILVALETIRRHVGVPQARRLLAAVFAVNLLIPSVYVGLNTGVVLKPGVYSHVYGLMVSAGRSVEQKLR